MTRLSLLALALGGLLAQPAAAIEVLGGSVALSFDKSNDPDFKRGKLAGSIELGFGGKISGQIDVVVHHFNAGPGSTETNTSFGLHGIYRINPDLAVGIFAGREVDDLAFGESNFYGIEAAYQINKIALQGYYGRSEPSGAPFDLNIFGASIDYEISQSWSAGLRYDAIDTGFSDVSSFALRGTYTMNNSVAFFAEVSSVDFGPGGDDAFFGVGVSYGFGANKKATFNPRGGVATLGVF